jgi:hypothetical protein
MSVEPVVRRRAPIVLRVAVAVVVIVLGLVGFVTPVRDAVADWLGIGAVRVEIVDALPDDLATTFDLGESVDVGSVDLGLPGLGAPAAAFRRGGEVSVVWAPSDELPEVGATGVGAILTRFDGTLDPAVEKSIGAGTTLTIVTIEGVTSYWIEGAPHSFAYLDAEAAVVETTARLAGNTLIWEADGFTWRLESGLALEHVLTLFGE